MPVHWMWLDWIFLAIIGLSTIIAWFRGFVREAISLISWILSLVLGLFFASSVGGFLFSGISSKSLRFGIGFLIIFFAILILGMVINFILSKIIKGSGLGFFDSIFGLVFGFLRGSCVVMVIVMFLAMPWISATGILDRSVIASIAHPMVTWSMSFMKSKKIPSKVEKAVNQSEALIPKPKKTM